MRFLLPAVVFVAACGVRTPPPLDVAALVRVHGEVGARRELTARVLGDPRDVQARLALAALADSAGRPSEAIEQLEAVVRLGGPIGTRWRDADRLRLGRLLLARARARVARGAASALADFERAATFGALATAEELARAEIAVAIAELRHVDDDERAKGRARLARQADALATSTTAAGAWRGARAAATPGERAAFGRWLWSIGARREAYEQLARWHAATKPPRDAELQGAYLRALAWWSPVWLGEVKPPPAAELVGPERCWFPGTDCEPPAMDDPPAIEEPPAPSGFAVAAPPIIAAAVRYATTRVALADMLDATGRLDLGNAGGGPQRRDADDTASGLARHERDVAALVAIAQAFVRDPAIAERLGRDLVARAADAALGHATLGALFDALGDPARARAAWQAAVDGSAEPLFQRGLAEAAARTGDGAAALVFATHASAAWGDPAVVWTSVARQLVAARQLVDALTAARNAIDLAGTDVLPSALEVASEASRALGRTRQADELLAQHARLPMRAGANAKAVRDALVAHHGQPTAATTAQLWVASRAVPRDVEVRAALVEALDGEDPRRATIVDELVELAGDHDGARAYAAVVALRR